MATAGLVRTRDDADQSGFASAIASQNSQLLAGMQFQVHLIKHRYGAVPGGEVAAYVVQRDQSSTPLRLMSRT